MLDTVGDQIFLTPAELLAAVAEHERRAAVLALAARHVEVSGAWATDGAVSFPAWLRSNATMTEADARRLVTHGRFLDTFPAFAEAVLSGTLSAGQVDAMRAVTNRRVEPVLREQQHDMIDTLSGLSIGDTHITCADWRDKADAIVDGPEPRQEQTRELHYTQAGDGKTVGKLVLDEFGGVELDKAILNALTHQGVDEQRSLAERRGDALVDICSFFNHNHLGEGSPRHLPHVTLNVDARDLPDRPTAVNDDTGRFVSSGCTDRYLCDCKIHTILRDADGAPIGFGRTRYTIPRELFRQIAARDGGCRLGDCNRPVRFTEAHHIVYWRHGGTTDYWNLVLLCSRHHHDVHKYGLTLELHPNGDLTVTWPNGHTHTSKPRGRSPRRPGTPLPPASVQPPQPPG